MKFLLISVLILLVVAGGGIYLVVRNTSLFPLAPPKISAPEEKVRIGDRVRDEQGLFSVEIPSGWTAVNSESDGLRISAITAESPDFVSVIDYENNNPRGELSYTKGAVVAVEVLEGAEEPMREREANFSERQEILIDREKAVYYVFRAANPKGGEFLDAQTVHKDRTYFLRLGYNPSTFPEGKELFRKILMTFRFED